VPFALAALLVSSLLLREPLYRIAFWAQIGFYGLSLLAIAQLKPSVLGRMADAAFTFVGLNTAAGDGVGNFVTGKKAAWGR